MGSKPLKNQTQGIDAELAAFINTVGSKNLVLNNPIHL
ncbi:hypothetical protein NIES2098_44880 [Calothrix sp. NIES-2098]|nr:hypothetical protein NIES2098_44880 [Calothrix sp. NIES-2098]